MWNIESKCVKNKRHYVNVHQQTTYFLQTLTYFSHSMQYSPICFQCTLSLLPENIRKPYDFLMFSRGNEKVHWVQMG